MAQFTTSKPVFTVKPDSSDFHQYGPVPPSGSPASIPTGQPKTTAAAQALQGLAANLKYPTFDTPAPIAPGFAAKGPALVGELTPEFIQNLLNPLTQQYFGPGGALQQTLSGAEQKGLLFGGLGGVPGQQITQGVTTPFAQAASTAIAQLKFQTDQFNANQITQFNTTLANLQNIDQGNVFERAKAQADLKFQFDALGAELQKAASGLQSEAEQQETLNKFKAYELAVEQYKLAEAQRQFNAQTAVQLTQIPGAQGIFPYEATGIPKPVFPGTETAGFTSPLPTQGVVAPPGSVQQQAFELGVGVPSSPGQVVTSPKDNKMYVSAVGPGGTLQWQPVGNPIKTALG